MHLIVFDSEIRNNFTPINLNKPTFEVLVGGKTILENLLEIINPDQYSLLIPNYLKKNAKNKHKVSINEEISEIDEKETVFVNSLIDLNNIPVKKLKENEDLALISNNNLILSKCRIKKINKLDNNDRKLIKIIGDCKIKLESENNLLIKYPWELLEMNNQLLTKNINKKLLNREINVVRSNNKFINIILQRQMRIDNNNYISDNNKVLLSGLNIGAKKKSKRKSKKPKKSKSKKSKSKKSKSKKSKSKSKSKKYRK